VTVAPRVNPGEWPREIWVNGRIVGRSEAAVSVEDRGFQFGDGLYEVIRAYGGKLFRMDSHMRRLARGADFLELELAPGHIDEIRAVSNQLVERSALQDAAVIMFVTRGAASRSHAPPEGMRPTIVVYVRPATTPAPALLRDGIAAITVTDSRWGHVNVKSLALQPNVLAKRRALRAGAAEAIFIRDGYVTDCTASNPFFVVRGQVRTPPESNYILSGITREATIELCRQEGIECAEVGVLDTDLLRVDEAFLTGTSDEITPVVRIDAHVIGDGKPGPITQRLAQAFRRVTRG
jgi:D-alanine transaminase